MLECRMYSNTRPVINEVAGKAIDVATFAALTFLLWLGVMAFASSIAGYVTILLGMAAAAFKVPPRIMKLTSKIKDRYGLNPVS
jgi:hypothetical protein